MAHFSFEFYPKSLGRRVKASLVVPSLNLHGCLSNQDKEYYEHREEKFPLLVFLCGFGDNLDSWERSTPVVELAEKNRFAALFLDGENSWYLNRGPLADYESYLDEELLDFVYGNFKNLSREKPLVICGVSMGGYGALRHYLKRGDLYDAAVALSPATKPDQLDEASFGGTLRDAFLSRKGEKLRVYLSVGEKDFIINASKELDAFLRSNGIGVQYRYVPNADHSWSTWRLEIENVVRYLKNQGFISESYQR